MKYKIYAKLSKEVYYSYYVPDKSRHPIFVSPAIIKKLKEEYRWYSFLDYYQGELIYIEEKNNYGFRVNDLEIQNLCKID